MEREENSAIVVMITAGNRDEAERLAGMLVERRLAGCVQILPEMLSVYRWQETVELSPEHLLLVKTRQTHFAEIEREVRLSHSYDTPEIIALPIVAGSDAYLNWLRANT